VQLLPKASNELRPSIRNDRIRNSMQTYHACNIDFSILLDVIVGVHGYEVSIFGESVHNHPNRIILEGSQRQTYNEVHTNVIPLPI
jgi:hypothetical protein